MEIAFASHAGPGQHKEKVWSRPWFGVSEGRKRGQGGGLEGTRRDHRGLLRWFSARDRDPPGQRQPLNSPQPLERQAAMRSSAG